MQNEYNKNVMNREETLEYINDLLENNKRVVAVRYNDGEYNAMAENGPTRFHDDRDIVKKLLKEAIVQKNQLLCINYLKEKNIRKEDCWCRAQTYLKEASNHDLYGCVMWPTYDFITGSNTLSKFFKNKTLIVTGHGDLCRKAFNNIDVFETPTKNASQKHEELLYCMIPLCEKYDNIIFCCGPVGKWLISKIVNNCTANLIDIGCLINAILYKHDASLIKKWTMSWTKKEDIKSLSNQFFEKIS